MQTYVHARENLSVYSPSYQVQNAYTTNKYTDKPNYKSAYTPIAPQPSFKPIKTNMASKPVNPSTESTNPTKEELEIKLEGNNQQEAEKHLTQKILDTYKLKCMQGGYQSKTGAVTDYPHEPGNVKTTPKGVPKTFKLDYNVINREKMSCSSGYHLEQDPNPKGLDALGLQGVKEPKLIKPHLGWTNRQDGYSGYTRAKYQYANYNINNTG